MQPSDEEVQQRLIKSIGNLVASPEVYDAFIKSWHSVIDGGALDAARISAVESEAANAIAALSDLDTVPERGPLALENIGEPAFLLDEEGSIRDINDMAWQRYRVDTGGVIGDLDLDFFRKDALDQALSTIVKTNAITDLPTMLPCFDPSVNGNLTVLCVKAPPSPKWPTPSILVTINTGQGAGQGAQLLADGYALTKNEHEVLLLFLTGRGLHEIADLRGRSLPTVRNQMQSIFEKTRCNGQADLMRLAFSLSSLVAEVSPLIESATRSNQTSVTFLRPDGRVIDVTVAGAKQGRVVVSLPSIFGHPLTPHIEEKLAQAGIRMLCIARPGMGSTDPPPPDTSEVECLRDDILAVLDQLRETSCILVGRASAAPTVFELCALLQQKISKAVIVNAVVPSSFVKQDDVASTWTQSLMAAVGSSPTVARLIIRSGRRLMRVIGPGRFLNRMYGNSATDEEALNDPDVVRCIEEGAQMTTAQGFEAGSRDMMKALGNWTDCVEKCPLKVLLIQGDLDPNVPINAAREFAATYASQCTLKKIDGGGLLNFSHPDEIIHEFMN